MHSDEQPRLKLDLVFRRSWDLWLLHLPLDGLTSTILSFRWMVEHTVFLHALVVLFVALASNVAYGKTASHKQFNQFSETPYSF